MATDYPDWTSMVQIVGSDVDLDINLVASDITVAVIIAASAVTLDVNLTAQDVNINIDIEAQSVGLYSYPAWAAKEGEDKNFGLYAGDKAWGEYGTDDYTVPTGKALFICGMTFEIVSLNAADYDHHLHFRGELQRYINASMLLLAAIGGNGGGGLTFPKPIPFTAAQKMRLYMANSSNVACNLRATCWGYEIDV